jgi:hypothetical protein
MNKLSFRKFVLSDNASSSIIFKYLGTTVTKKNRIHKEINSKLNSGTTAPSFGGRLSVAEVGAFLYPTNAAKLIKSNMHTDWS